MRYSKLRQLLQCNAAALAAGLRSCHRCLVYGLLVWTVSLLSMSPVLAEETEMKVGDAAPEFTLQDQNAVQRQLVDYRGQWLVLYFYPKNDTPGCTTEACNFRDDYFEIKKLGAEVMGISLDTAGSHAEFAKKFSLPFPLLADVDAVVAKQYGSLWGIWPLRYARRHTFLINPDGKIAKIYRDVEPKKHSAELIAAIKAVKKELAGSKP